MTKKIFRRLALVLTVAIMCACNATAQSEKDVDLTPAQRAAYDNIMTRTSIRSWENKAVEPAKVEMLLRAHWARRRHGAQSSTSYCGVWRHDQGSRR